MDVVEDRNPRLSVVIPAESEVETVVACVRSLVAMIAGCAEGVELIVPSRLGTALRDALAAVAPHAIVVDAAASATASGLRRIGAERSRGEVVAFLGDRYSIAPGWPAAVLAAHGRSPGVVAGCVAPAQGCDVVAGCVAAGRSLRPSGVAYFLEGYSHAMPPLPGGPLALAAATMVPAGNVSYARAALDVAPPLADETELEYHGRLFRLGARFCRAAELDVALTHPPSPSRWVRERFALSRRAAARRAAALGWPRRVLAGLARGALPPVRLTRIAARLARPDRFEARYAAALPWLIVFLVTESAGEIAGYLGFRARQSSV